MTEGTEITTQSSDVKPSEVASGDVVIDQQNGSGASGGGGDDSSGTPAVTTPQANDDTAVTTDTNGDTMEKQKEMRAIVLTGFGGLKFVKTLKKPEPVVQAGEVLIRVKSCGLNFQDLVVRLGAIDSPPKTPCILGFECAGEIEAVGEGVENFVVGDRVVALPEFKGWAELVAVPEKFVYKIPDNMSFSDATALTLSYLVAYILVFDLAAVRAGKSVLIHSAGGAVGQAIAQLCKTIGNVTLFGIASKIKHEALQANGLIDHLIERGSDHLNEVRKVSSEGVDIVFDCICGEECNRGYNILKPMGKYVLFGSAHVVTGETKSFFSLAKSWWRVDKISPIKLFDENKSLMGFNLRHLMYQQNGADYVRDIIKLVYNLWSDGKIKPIIDSTWALEDIGEAMQKMHDRENIGKLVLDPAQAPKPKPATPAKGKIKDKKQTSEDKDKKTEGEAVAVAETGAAADGEKKETTETVAVKSDVAVTNGAGGDETTAPVAEPTVVTTNGSSEKESRTP